MDDVVRIVAWRGSAAQARPQLVAVLAAIIAPTVSKHHS